MSRIGEMLVKAGLITQDHLKKALLEQKKRGGKVGTQLVKLGYVSEEDITEFLSEQYGVPSINLSHFEIEASVIKLIPNTVARKYTLVPINRTGSTLTIAIADPSNVSALDDINFMTGYHVEPVVASEGSIHTAIEKYYGSGKALAVAGGTGLSTEIDTDAFNLDDSVDDVLGGISEDFQMEEEQIGDFGSLIGEAVEDMELINPEDEQVDLSVAEEAPIIKLVNGILKKAIVTNTSDIHIEPYEKSFRVRYRVDGTLHKELGLPLEIKNAITSRLKIMAKLDISERRLPQDGRIKMRISKNKDMDFRVSVLPCLFGEKIVLRLLDKSNLQLDMTKLGFDVKQLDDFQEGIHKPFGMCLVTGPTGSGKTTTLYSALSLLNQVTENLMTAEDPVEFNLEGINQVQMHDEIGLNFSAALRSFLRQDPDKIMVGEIRDFETAEIAIKAALTGHMVLSTLHTNDAPSTVNRLLNMGVEPFLVTSACILIVAQRLARKMCSECKEPIETDKELLISLGMPSEEAETVQAYKGKGCPKCNKGYKGRVALYEVMPFDDELRELILHGASNIELKRCAVKNGMATLRRSALNKMKEGVTTIEEVIKTTFGD